MFDAVAYTAATKMQARLLCKRLPDEVLKIRHKRFGWRRFTCSGDPISGYIMMPDLYGSGSLEPKDFDWTDQGEGLYGGFLKEGALERISVDKIGRAHV